MEYTKKIKIANTLISHMKGKEYATFHTDNIAAELKIRFIDALNRKFKNPYNHLKIELGAELLEIAENELNPPNWEYGNLEIDHNIDSLYTSIGTGTSKMDAYCREIAKAYLETIGDLQQLKT